MKTTWYIYNIDTKAVVATVDCELGESAAAEARYTEYDQEIYGLTSTPAFGTIDGLIDGEIDGLYE